MSPGGSVGVVLLPAIRPALDLVLGSREGNPAPCRWWVCELHHHVPLVNALGSAWTRCRRLSSLWSNSGRSTQLGTSLVAHCSSGAALRPRGNYGKLLM